MGIIRIIWLEPASIRHYSWTRHGNFFKNKYENLLFCTQAHYRCIWNHQCMCVCVCEYMHVNSLTMVKSMELNQCWKSCGNQPGLCHVHIRLLNMYDERAYQNCVVFIFDFSFYYVVVAVIMMMRCCYAIYTKP